MLMTPHRVRVTLFSAVLIGILASAIVILVKGAGGSLVAPAMTDAFARLLQFYLPMLLIVATFYFTEKRKETEPQAPPRTESYAAGILLVGIWVILPVGALLMSTDYQAAFEFLGAFRGFGDGVGNAALVYCFLKSA